MCLADNLTTLMCRLSRKPGWPNSHLPPGAPPSLYRNGFTCFLELKMLWILYMCGNKIGHMKIIEGVSSIKGLSITISYVKVN